MGKLKLRATDVGLAVLGLFLHLSLAWAADGLSGPALATEVGRWLNREQGLIDRSVNEEKIYPPDVHKQDVKYRPESKTWFPLKSVWVPESELHVADLQSMIPPELYSELVRTKDGVKQYRLFVHPESEKFYAKFIDKYPVTVDHVATSTASSRSLLVCSESDPSKAFFVKLSLDVELGGVVRTIPKGEVARSVGTTAYVASQQGHLNPRFQIIPEVLGIHPKGQDRGGQIIRLIPEDLKKGKVGYIPLFSLYAKATDGTTLLETMSREAGLKPSEYVRQKILTPFLEAWTDWATQGGIVMEAHAQNVLLEVDAQGKPTGRFIQRDFGGFNLDGSSPLMDQKELKKLPVFTTFEEDYHQAFSKKAQVQSLKTYFEGGFLYNIDRELVRIEPGYKPKAIYGDFWKESAEMVSKKTGLAAEQVTLQKARDQMDVLLGRGWQKIYAERHSEPLAPSSVRGCFRGQIQGWVR